MQPRYDQSNNNNLYTRNKIRNKLIPYIQEEFNPNIIETLNRLSTLVLQEESYMEKNIEINYHKILKIREKTKIEIDVHAFNALDPYIKSRIILYIVKELFGDTKGIESVHIEDIMKLCSNNIGNKYLTPNKNIKVFIKSGIVSFEKVLK